MKNQLTLKVLLLSLFCLLLLSCSNSQGTGASKPKSSMHLTPAGDCTSLEARLKDELIQRYDRMETRYLYGGVALLTTRDTATTGSFQDGNSTATAPSASQESASHSTTNVQEKGVDEGDLVKTDGEYLYLARGSRFLILKARPAAETAIVSDMELNDAISELYLEGGTVTILTSGYGSAGSSGTQPAVIVPSGTSVTRLYVVDVANPSNPVIQDRYEFPGTLQGSRRISSTLYVVTNHTVDLPQPAYPWDYMPSSSYDSAAYSNAVTLARAENMRRIDLLTLDDMLPEYTRTGYSSGTAGTSVSAPSAACSDIYAPETSNGTDMALVFSLDLSSTPAEMASTGVLTSWSRIYMSTESLYLASGNDWSWIEPVATNGLPAENPEPWTALHKFALGTSGGVPAYTASGKVNGWLNNQFSMGEYNGYLRIGTTRGGWWGEGISNQLAILSEQEGELTEIGRIENLAPGERIYSMRFDRDRGYMVTFKQTDPLFTFDLSVPAQPRLAGEIEVNGFATYIHLLGESNNRLLTIGRSANASGQVTGNKLQLFDVSDLASPKLLGDFELGSGWSDALYDHHSFLYYEQLSLLAIPYYSDGIGPSYQSGLKLFKVDSTGIRDHGFVEAPSITTGYGTYADTIDRAVVIGTDVYGVAHRSVTVASVETLSIEASVLLPESYRYYLLYPAVLEGSPTVSLL